MAIHCITFLLHLNGFGESVISLAVFQCNFINKLCDLGTPGLLLEQMYGKLNHYVIKEKTAKMFVIGFLNRIDISAFIKQDIKSGDFMYSLVHSGYYISYYFLTVFLQ